MDNRMVVVAINYNTGIKTSIEFNDIDNNNRQALHILVEFLPNTHLFMEPNARENALNFMRGESA